jgi:hypothetical protein
MLGPRSSALGSPSNVDKSALVSAPFARTQLPGTQSALDQLDEPLRAFGGVCDEAKSQASLDGQYFGPQPLRGVPVLSPPQQPLEAPHRALQSAFRRFRPFSPILELDHVSHEIKLRERV